MGIVDMKNKVFLIDIDVSVLIAVRDTNTLNLHKFFSQLTLRSLHRR